MTYNPKDVRKGDREITATAITRAEKALESLGGDYGVGYCEGIIELNQLCFTCVWCAVVTRNGTHLLGGGVHIPLNPSLLRKKVTGELLEKDIEDFVQENFPQAYKILVEYALLSLVNSK